MRFPELRALIKACKCSLSYRFLVIESKRIRDEISKLTLLLSPVDVRETTAAASRYADDTTPLAITPAVREAMELCASGSLDSESPLYAEYSEFSLQLLNHLNTFSLILQLRLAKQKRQQTPPRLLPIRTGMKVSSASRAATEFCRLEERFDNQVVEGLATVGIRAYSLNNMQNNVLIVVNSSGLSYFGSWKIYKLPYQTYEDANGMVSYYRTPFLRQQLQTPGLLAGLLSLSPFAAIWSTTPTFLSVLELYRDEGRRLSHAIGCLMLRVGVTRYVVCLNGYILPNERALYIRLAFEEGVKVLIYPNDLFPAEADPEQYVGAYNLQNAAKEYSSPGECQEYSIVLAWLAVKQGVIAKLGTDEFPLAIKTFYESGLSLAAFNEYRRQARLLGGQVFAIET